jgi:hypothetical protein
MRESLALMVCVVSLVQRPSAQAPKADELAPLNQIIGQVKAALEEYQMSFGTGKDALPPLSSAEFDFKTTMATTVGASVNLFIFKFGTSHKTDVVNDVTYSRR